jgi:hypothetical protein
MVAWRLQGRAERPQPALAVGPLRACQSGLNRPAEIRCPAAKAERPLSVQ